MSIQERSAGGNAEKPLASAQNFAEVALAVGKDLKVTDAMDQWVKKNDTFVWDQRVRSTKDCK